MYCELLKGTVLIESKGEIEIGRWRQPMRVIETPPVVILLLLSLLMLACGASQKSGKRADEEECNAGATSILETEAMCNPPENGAYEAKLKKWQVECEHNAQPLTRNLIAQRLANSRKCVQDTNRIDTQRSGCRHRVDVAMGKKRCEKEQCGALLAELNEIIADCAKLGDKNTGLSDAKALLAEILEKTAETDSKKEIETLAEQCDKATQLAAENNTDGALKLLILALAGSEVQKLINGEKQADESIGETLSRCKEAFKLTIDKHVSTISASLQRDARKSSPEKWLSLYRNLEGTNTRLQEVRVEGILPGALEEMQQVLLKFDKQRNINESKSIDKSGAENRKVLNGGVEKCKNLVKNLERFDGKVKEHTKANNEKKVKAYSRKLQQAKEALDEFEIDIRKSLDSSDIPEKKRKELEEDLREAGCSI